MLDYESVCPPESLASLAPFSEVFDVALNQWITTRHQFISGLLRDRLMSDAGLWRSLDALDQLYFLRDGSLASTTSTTIFVKIDRGTEAWNDRFLLTELFQSVYGDCVDADNLTIRSAPGKFGGMLDRRRSVKILDDFSLDYAVRQAQAGNLPALTPYKLPWPIRNIIRDRSQAVYQRIFGFLLQIRRASSILERLRLVGDEVASGTPNVEHDLFLSLRHRLLWFASVAYTHLTEVVIGPSTAQMRARMAVAADVDAMIAVHDTYATCLEEQCLLAKNLAPIHQAVIAILDQAVLLADIRSANAGIEMDDRNRSFSISTRLSLSSSRRILRQGRRERHASVASDPDSNSGDIENAADKSYVSTNEISLIGRLDKIKVQFNRLVGFVAVGLRGLSRAGGSRSQRGRGGVAADETSRWDLLADRLEWGGY